MQQLDNYNLDSLQLLVTEICKKSMRQKIFDPRRSGSKNRIGIDAKMHKNSTNFFYCHLQGPISNALTTVSLFPRLLNFSVYTPAAEAYPPRQSFYRILSYPYPSCFLLKKEKMGHPHANGGAYVYRETLKKKSSFINGNKTLLVSYPFAPPPAGADSFG